MIESMEMKRENAICLLPMETKRDAIRHVVDSCPVFSVVPDHDRFLRAVFRRERVESTGIGHGVAIAHGKIIGLNTVAIALGISKEGIEYGSVDGNKVHLLFVIASSPTTQLVYLRQLCRLLECARRPDVRSSLDAFSGEDFPSFCRKMEDEVFSWLWQEPLPTCHPSAPQRPPHPAL